MKNSEETLMKAYTLIEEFCLMAWWVLNESEEWSGGYSIIPTCCIEELGKIAEEMYELPVLDEGCCPPSVYRALGIVKEYINEI